MDRKFTFEEGEYYHIYNRGVDKRKIFFSKGDWNHFQRLLFVRNSAGGHIRLPRSNNVPLAAIKREGALVDICAYAMMSNHFHLLVRDKGDDSTSKFMGKFLTAFSLYMNKKYERSGPMMCRPFRAKHIDSDEYFRFLISYIHLNPMDQMQSDWKEKGIRDKKQALEFLRGYEYSSYYDYFVRERDESLVLSKESLPVGIDDLEDLSAMLDASRNEIVKSE